MYEPHREKRIRNQHFALLLNLSKSKNDYQVNEFMIQRGRNECPGLFILFGRCF